MFILAYQKCDWHDWRPLLLLQLRPVLASTWGDCVFQLDRDTKYNTVCAQSVFHLSPVQRLTQSTYLSCFFITAGFPDYVSPPRGGDLPHHVLIREQHGPSGNLGHVSPRCSRRADRGEWGWFGHMGGALKLRVPSFTTALCTAIIIHLWSNWAFRACYIVRCLTGSC